MNNLHDFRMWVFPVLAILAGLVGYFRCKDGKNAEVWRCIFCCGAFILLWILTFGGYAIR